MFFGTRNPIMGDVCHVIRGGRCSRVTLRVAQPLKHVVLYLYELEMSILSTLVKNF